MNVTLDCPGCDRQLRVNAQFAGKKVRCPRCGTVSTVPAAGGPEPSPEPLPDVVPVGVFAPEGRAKREDPPDGGESHVPCEGCGALVRVTEDARRKAPLCSACRRAVKRKRAPEEVDAPPARARAPRLEEGDARCPECDAGMAAGAVLCIECGYNTQTGKRLKTVSRRIARHWYSGGMSLAGRLVAFVLLLGLCGFVLFAISRDAEVEVGVFILVPIAVAALAGLLVGTFHKGVVTTDSQGTPLLIKSHWICFIPSGQATLDLTDYRTIRLGHTGGGGDDGGANFGRAAVGFALFGLAGLLIGLFARQAATGTFTVEIAGAGGDADVPPQLLYRGRSEKTMRTISDALEQVAGLRYG